MTGRFRRGVVAGKFWPLHAGHQVLLDAAAAACADIDVVVADDPVTRPPAPRRAGWIRALYPRAVVHVVEDVCTWHRGSPCVPGCSPRWVAALRSAGIDDVDAVFSSEDYGNAFAAAWGPGCVHVPVDPARRARPVSGTAVRAEPARYWPMLSEVVRRGLVRRIVVLGAESTGTSTLAAELAATLAAPLVLEYGREHSARLAAAAGGIEAVRWTAADFEEITVRQRQLEADAVTAAAAGPFDARFGPLVVCDTDLVATAVWAERYLGVPAAATRAWADGTGDPGWLYVLTGDEIPFVDDGLRDGEHLRAAMTARFAELLDTAGVPWLRSTGTRADRVDAVTAAIAERAAADPWLGEAPAAGQPFGPPADRAGAAR